MDESLASPRRAERDATRPSPASMIAAADARVLVVDDVADNRDLLVRRLARLGITSTVQAENGQEALQCLQHGKFDLVLLDIMMPIMTGFQVLQQLNAEGRIHDLPVIVISAMSEVDYIASCIEEGAEDFLLKPFNPTMLRARVLASLEKKFLRDRTRQELQRKQAELAEARMLQLALAPPPQTRKTAFGTISIDLVLDPAREVGGDLVDHFAVGDTQHVLVLGDVSDKGAGAALMMARTSAIFRSLAARPDAAALFTAPESAMHVVNAVLAAGNPSCMFVTLLLATFDLASGQLRYVRAGHVPPFLRRADGRMESLTAPGGLPLGVMEEAVYNSSVVELAPGDCLLVITDGISEAVAPDNAMFGEDRTAAWLAAPGREPPQVADLVALVRAHEQGAPPSDDVAAILLRLHSEEDVALDVTVAPELSLISALVEQAMDVLQRRGVDTRTTHHVALILDELLTNIGSHGVGVDLPCHVRVIVAADRVSVTIEDSAQPFDPRTLPPPDTEADVENRAIGGLGVHLVLNFAQGFDYRSHNGVNTTSLWIARSNQPQLRNTD